MNYETFCNILNKHIFEGEKKELLGKIAEKPERFIGLFRPTKPVGKILQHILQSHEIRMGDAFEEFIEEILKEKGFICLPKRIIGQNNETLNLDQCFTDKRRIYFIEQKIRDDHDSSKKRGQMANFERKLETLYKKHGDNLVGIIYFIDPDLTKNKYFYQKEIANLERLFEVKLYLFYGKELFTYLKADIIWDNIINWLRQWKDSLPELPEINFDESPEKSFNEIKELELIHWRKIIQNRFLWEERIIKTISKEGKTLKLVSEFFKSHPQKPYRYLGNLLEDKINHYY